MYIQILSYTPNPRSWCNRSQNFLQDVNFLVKVVITLRYKHFWVTLQNAVLHLRLKFQHLTSFIYVCFVFD